MNIKLSAKDKKILKELSQDSRQTTSQVAKRVRLSKQVVDYRIKNLVKKGVIRKFFTAINWNLLGYMSFRLYLRLSNISPTELRSMVGQLKNFKGVYFVGLCEGSANLIIRFLVKRAEDFQALLDELMGKFGGFIHDKEVTVVTADPLGFTIAGAHIWEEKENIPVEKMKYEEVKVDEKDLEILSILTDNSRTPVVDIARKINMSADSVGYRIKRLIRGGVILGFRLFIDSSKLDFEHRKIFLRLGYTTKKRKRDFFDYYSIHPNVVFLLGCIGNWDAELDFDVRNTRHFHDLVTDLKNNFGDIIKNYETAVFLEEYYPNAFANLQLPLLKHLISSSE